LLIFNRKNSKTFPPLLNFILKKIFAGIDHNLKKFSTPTLLLICGFSYLLKKNNPNQNKISLDCFFLYKLTKNMIFFSFNKN